jgi:3-hydroxyisobutyrate dehydrogenase
VRVAFLGLGAMGRPMAANLAAGHETWVHNRTTAVSREHAAAHGTRAAADLAEIAGAEPEVVATCLPTTVEVTALAEELLGRLRPGTVWLDHTSGDPAGTRVLAERCAAHEVTLLDAPVSGGTDGAAAGTLTVMVGGSREALERVRDVLDTVAGRVVHVGPSGAGMAVKAVNNALLATSLRAAAEGLVALRASGVPTSTALEVINTSSGRSFATERLLPERVVPRTFPPTFSLGLLAKDVGLATGVVRDAGLEAPVLDLVDELVRVAADTRGGAVDHTELVRMVEDAAGVVLGDDGGRP